MPYSVLKVKLNMLNTKVLDKTSTMEYNLFIRAKTCYGGRLGAQLKVASEVGFARRQNHPLSKLLKSLTAESQDAVDTLVKLMKSEDDKIKLGAATKLLEFQESVAKSIENDAMMRLMANAKYGGPKQLGYDPDNDDDSPDVDFTQVLPAN